MNIELAARDLLLKNRREHDGYLYTLPSADHYPYQWLWDSCFHAIILAQYDPEAAKKELRSLLSKQFSDGMLPHIIYWQPGILHLFRWGAEGTSTLTQPPMIAYAAWEIHRASNDLDFLRLIYPSLVTFYRYLIERRDPRHHDLVGIVNPDESGEDNSPRFDAVLGAPAGVTYEEHHDLRVKLVDANRECGFDVEHCMRNFFWVKDAPFNAILVENLRTLAHIASLLGHTDDEHYMLDHAERIAKAMRTYMFEDGVYWSLYTAEYKKLKVATWAHFAPLFAGLYSEDEARALLRDHFTNEETFRARYGIRTVSKQEAGYRAEGFGEKFSWRGPVWMSTQWFIYRGLMRYGFKEEAAWIRDTSLELLQKSGFRECFNPDTGEGQGAHGFTWGALVLDMKERA